MTTKHPPSREVMDRRNERRRTYNAFKDLNNLILEIEAGSVFGVTPLISPEEAKMRLKALYFHYSGRIDPERENEWIKCVSGVYNLIAEYAPHIPTGDMDTISQAVLDAMREMEASRKVGRPKKTPLS